MQMINIIQEIMTLVQQILVHFVTGTSSTVTQLADNEWSVTQGAFQVSQKGNYLSAAVADIAVYGAILVDWIVQALLNNGVNAYNGLTP